MRRTLTAVLLLLALPLLAQRPPRKDYLVTINTTFGPMHFVLYDQTPQHKTNFLKLAQAHFYDSLLFHRIIAGFMIQGGDPASKRAGPGARLGEGDVGYTVPAEFVPALIHRKGALAAARDNNPQKASSGCQFYIVQGKPLNDSDMVAAMQRSRAASQPTYTAEQRKVYATEGGTPHLDQNYTTFGQLIGGMDTLDKIAAQPKDEYDRPRTDLRMTVAVEKMRKKKITRLYGYTFPTN